MKLLILCLFASVLLFTAGDVKGNKINIQPDQLCDPDFITYPDNLISAHEIDVDLDSTSELLLLMQFNNNAQFHLFYQTECGFKKVTDSRGEFISFLSWASSSICQPLGCLENTFCVDSAEGRHLVNVSGGHTLTIEQEARWLHGKLSDKDVTSQITIKKYQLADGKLYEVDSRMVLDMKKNMALFRSNNPDGADDLDGFEISTCD